MTGRNTRVAVILRELDAKKHYLRTLRALRKTCLTIIAVTVPGFIGGTIAGNGGLAALSVLSLIVALVILAIVSLVRPSWSLSLPAIPALMLRIDELRDDLAAADQETTK